MPNAAPFVDIHCHLLPGVDDGAANVDESLRLIEQGIEDGVGAWVLTPHVMTAFTEEIDERHRAAFAELMEAVEQRGFGIELYLASEIMFQEDVDTIRLRRTATFNENGRYFLMEFPIAFFPSHAEEILFKFQIAKMTPIIAHVERYASLTQQPQTIARMVERGILFQVNARSLMKRAPTPLRRIAEDLVMSGAVHFVASDAHNPENRPVELREAYEHTIDLTDEETANRLFIVNPRAAITGDRIEIVQFELPERSSWLSRFLDRFSHRTPSEE